MKIRIACIQMDARDQLERNLHQAFQLGHHASGLKAGLIAYPETFLFRGAAARNAEVAARTKAVLHKFQHLACMAQVPILMGSILEKSRQRGKYYNTSLLISETGQLIGAYRKIHLFDVKTPKNLSLSESRYIVPGRAAVTANLLGIRCGLTVCYDVRFPELFRHLAMKGAEVIFVPANFVQETGRAHWHTLLRARAIENLVYIVAPAQVGKNPATGVKSYGHSLIIDPWGEILAEGSGDRREVISAVIDTDKVHQLRRSFPVLQHSHFRI